MGILLLEYSDVQGVRKATEADGICRIRLLQGFGIVPRVMLVSAFVGNLTVSGLAEGIQNVESHVDHRETESSPVRMAS